jgi:hypothetical protein
MTGVESELARLGRRIENPTASGLPRQSLLVVARCGGRMQRIIPGQYILTSTAIAEMQRRDAEWSRLKTLWERSARKHGPEWTATGNRATELLAALLDDVASGSPPAVIVTATDGGQWQELPLPDGYCADFVPASAALIRGAVVAGNLHDRDILKFEGDALCFKRSDWSVWLDGLAERMARGGAPAATGRSPVLLAPAPAIVQPTSLPPAKPKKPDLNCMREWYRLERVEKHDAKKPPPSREDDQKAAREYFKMGGLNPLVRKARAAEAPWNWKQGGSRGRKAAELRARQKAQRDQPTR